MKTLKHTSLVSIALLLVLAVSSCGTSNFKGYYPENRITGKGIGRSQTPTTTADQNNAETVVVANTEVEVKNEKTAEEVILENRFMRKNMSEIATFASIAESTDTKSAIKELPWHQRLSAKVFSHVYKKQVKKYGSSSMSTADIFAIVSISAGGLALLSYYGSFLFGVGAIVMGALALKRGTSRRGMAIAGIVLGAVALVFWVSFFVWIGVRVI